MCDETPFAAESSNHNALGALKKGLPFSPLGYPALEVCFEFYVFTPSISSQFLRPEAESSPLHQKSIDKALTNR